MVRSPRQAERRELEKAQTGIAGLDEVTGGGLPKGRPTLVCGAAGCGKTLLAMEFLVRGATEFGEPGVFMAFEETAEELAQNVRSLGFDLPKLVRQKKLAVDYVRVERSEIEETGEYDLEALFVRVGHAIDTIGAKRVVLDTVESLFAGLSNQAILRAELRRLFRWLKDRGMTALITGERGDGQLTRHGLEEYVSDCVILLDHRVQDQRTTRRLRVVKYRGTLHGTNEYPFLIDETGIRVVPITSLGLEHRTSSERVSSGVAGLDEMLGGRGYYRASTVLVSGTPGTGKTTLACSFADACARRRERCLYLAFEESPSQIVRNMRSVGLQIEPHVESGLLRFHASRPTTLGLEAHLARLDAEIWQFSPRAVVIDPVTSLNSAGSNLDATQTVMRLVDMLKSRGITALMTSLSEPGVPADRSEVGISSLIDTWLLVRDIESNGERNRALYVLKSRGMAHSNQVREFLLTSRGLQLREVVVGPQGVLVGSARLAFELEQRAAALRRREADDRARRASVRRRAALEGRIAALRATRDEEEGESQRRHSQARVDGESESARFAQQARTRQGRLAAAPAPPPARTRRGGNGVQRQGARK
jgi:circadian clock protein KaiC